MNARVLKAAAALVVILLLLPGSVSSRPGGGIGQSSADQTLDSQPCIDWNLASDFRLWPDQENPNRDSCGNLGVWSFMSADLNGQTYTLLPNFDPDACGFPGMEWWIGPDSYHPLVGINATGEDQQCAGGDAFFPAGVAFVHPDVAERSVVGWRSPVDGHVEVTGSMQDLDCGCGDGILWFIDKNTQDLAWGNVPSCGAQDFRDGAGGNLLADIPVSQDDMLYFAVHPKSAYHCDMTGVDLSIHLLPYSISGTAIDIHGAGIANVLISAGDLLTTTTDLDGNYALRAYDGTYTLTPTLEGYSFEPATRTVDVPPDATGQHFVGTSLTPMHVAGVSLTKAGTGPWRLTARGYVHDAAHAPLPGVQVTGQWRLPDGALRYRQFTTAAQGGWQFLLNASLAGQYRFCVVNLVKAGYVYATADDHPSPPCKLIALP